MKDEFINKFMALLVKDLEPEQLVKVRGILYIALEGSEIIECKNEVSTYVSNDDDLIKMFLVSKKIDGCSDRTIKFYAYTLNTWLHEYIKKSVVDFTKDDIRMHFAKRMLDYPELKKTSLNNERRNFSSFFTWLVENDYIRSNPMCAVKKIKEDKNIRKPFTELEIEMMRDELNKQKNKSNKGTTKYKRTIRDIALFEVLLSTGCRAGEITGAKLCDLNLEKREMKVVGKGNKERVCYLNVRSAMKLKEYLNYRNKDSEYIFTPVLTSDLEKINVSCLEVMIRNLGKKLGIEAYPHKFRRTAATIALNKGMPIEEVQIMLGHEQIDTTLIYAKVKNSNVKSSHEKYMQ